MVRPPAPPVPPAVIQNAVRAIARNQCTVCGGLGDWDNDCPTVLPRVGVWRDPTPPRERSPQPPEGGQEQEQPQEPPRRDGDDNPEGTRTRDTFGEERPSKRIKRADETDGPDNATASKTTEQIVEFVDDEYIYLKEEQVFDPPPEHQEPGRVSGSGGSAFSGLTVSEVRDIVNNIRQRNDISTYLTLLPGEAVVDLGAGQDLIGHPAYKRLQEKLAESGLRTVEFQEDGPSPIGIGGKATPVCSALVPCMLGGTPGIVKVLVVEEDVPHLLSIGLLEHAGAMINTADDSIVFQEFGSKDKMRRLRSGHRTLQIATWSGKNFPAPAEIAQQYSLKEGDFQLQDRQAPPSYMEKEGCHRHVYATSSTCRSVGIQTLEKGFQQTVCLHANSQLEQESRNERASSHRLKDQVEYQKFENAPVPQPSRDSMENDGGQLHQKDDPDDLLPARDHGPGRAAARMSASHGRDGEVRARSARTRPSM